MRGRIRRVLGTLLGVVALLCAAAAYVTLEAGTILPIPFYWWLVVLVIVGLFGWAELLLWPGTDVRGFQYIVLYSVTMLALLGLIWLLWWLVFH